jgi:hypothetical protein
MVDETCVPSRYASGRVKDNECVKVRITYKQKPDLSEVTFRWAIGGN